MADKQLANKVLDYWFSIEFLGQDSYNTCTDKDNIIRDFNKFLKANEQEKAKRKQLVVFEELDEKKDINTLITNQARDCNMATWGNLTFYIGKIKRQICIEKLAEQLNIPLPKKAEANTEYIPLLSFQCTNKGVFIDHSLSLSTILWALSQIPEGKAAQISELLSETAYSKTLEELEKKHFNKEPIKAISITAGTDEIENEITPIFEENSITFKKINELYSNLVNTYEKLVGENQIEKVIGLKYQLFKNSAAKEKYDDDNYMGLNHDFFSSDLKMVKNNINEKKLKFDSGMLAALLSYICAPDEPRESRTRHDFIKPKDKDSFFDEMSEILNIKNAPLGKWPSRYMPALMQQVAINLTTANTKQGIFNKPGEIFSVNGPPGTGKTTLLKEVIASNVVNKAILLSKYDVPDKAFKEENFKYGECKNKAYTPYHPHWYSFKNESIADYGVLVTSCNNAAVENITKELPLGSGMRDNLEPITTGENKDSEEMQKQLGEIYELFCTEDNCNGNNEKSDEIYFTKYAKKFFGKGEKDADAWGLVAAPLGKKSNINSFYYDVLNPIHRDFLKRNDDIEERLPQYQKARDNFILQLKKVTTMREELGQYSDIVLQAHKALEKSKKSAEKNTELNDCYCKIKDLNTKLETKIPPYENEENEVNKLRLVCNEIEQRIKECQQEIDDLSEKEADYKKQARDVENSISRLTKIFNKTKYNESLKKADELRGKAEKFENASFEAEKKLIDEQAKFKVAFSQKDSAEQQLKILKNEIDSIKQSRIDLETRRENIQKEIQSAKAEAEELTQKRDTLLQQFAQAGKLKSGQVLDKDFVESILSKDETISTKAQITNPWTTQEYNREREKLFYYALQMTKEFLLSSKCCRANLAILGQYWGLNTDDNNKKINFHTKDKEEIIGSLFNTLFLLTPVISSTFASVGRLLKDIKKPGVIGTLIIDEAGQAQPQMAVGALFRARKSIIVGDPKQVEPVVTDDLDLLKKAYFEIISFDYTRKSISVQSCADIINPFGTFFSDDSWVGCPLLVHRRCISPMYEISNRISYDNSMKQQTRLPSSKKAETFLSANSCWTNIIGTEIGGGNHYVPKQGELVCRLIDKAFRLAEKPNLYIITPFKSVVNGIRNALKEYKRYNPQSNLAKSSFFDDWVYSHIGTVHKFQGKEANEVIFLLGCDGTVKNSFPVTNFVNSNIVNVAATRAKYRLYIIGDINVWRNNPFVKEAKAIIDTLPIENILKIDCWDDSEEKNEALNEQISKLPKAPSFASVITKNEDGEPEFEIVADEFISKINENSFFEKPLTDEQFKVFGFVSKESFEELPSSVRKNLLMGMKLYFFFKPIFSTETAKDSDVSFCGILFCKAMELYLKQNFVAGLKARFPDYEIKTASKQLVKLQDASSQDFMIGTIQYILKNKADEIGRYMSLNGEGAYTTAWWTAFNSKLKLFAEKRNKCCHHQVFKWHDMEQLLRYEFEYDSDTASIEPKIGGIFYESKNGEKLVK